MTPRRVWIAYAALAAATAFAPAFSGRLPVPGGAAVPGLSEPEPSDARNPELSDVPTQFVPWTKAVADAYHAGRLPLRLAANGCGVPLWANPQAQAATPTTVFAMLLPVPWALAAAAAVKLWLAAAGAFLFLRARGASTAAAAWGGLGYGFSLQMTCWILFPDTWPAALLPWTLLAVERVARGLPHDFSAAVAAVALLLLGGYPESELYVALASAAFFFAVLLHDLHARAARVLLLRRAARMTAAALLGAGLTAVYTIPAARALARSQRSVQVARALAEPTPPLSARDLLRPPLYWDAMRFWVVPEAQGNPRDGDKFGPYSFAGRASGYAGILAAAFALAAFFWRRAPAAVRWARPAVVGLALYVLWYPPLARLLRTAPLVREVAARLTTNRACSVLVLMVILLGALAFDRVRAGRGVGAARFAIGAALAVLAAVFVEFLGRPERAALTLGSWRAVSFWLPALSLAAALVLLAAPGGAERIRALTVLLVAATAVDLLKIGARFDPGTLPADYFPETPVVAELRDSARGGRFATSGIALTGVAAMYGLEDVRLHGVTAAADYGDVLAATLGDTSTSEYPSRLTRIESPFLHFLNVRARFEPGLPIDRRAAPAAVLPGEIVGARDRSALDRSTLLYRLARETDFERRAHALGPGETFSGEARLLAAEAPRPEELRFRISASAPRVLVVPATDDGGWTARAADRRLPTFTANGAFLAVRVPAGESEIVCRYAPPGFAAGLVVTGLSAAALAALSFRRRSVHAARRRGARSSSRSSAGAEARPGAP